MRSQHTTTESSRQRLARRVPGTLRPEDSRRHNRSLVLQHLFHTGPLSRADLARLTGLTRVTVSDLVGELHADGVVTELGTRQDGQARVGKPATLLGIDEHAYHVLSLDLSPADRFVGAVTTLSGTVEHLLEIPLNGAQGDAAVALAVELTSSLAAATSKRLLGVGVGTPGLVDHDGIVRQATNLSWNRVPLAEHIGRAVDCPVHLANDANAAALAVRTFREPGGDSLMVVRIQHGVGAGLVVGGALVEGEQFAAGEIGHIVVDEDGEPCSCGRRGCLELAVGAPYMTRRMAATGEPERVLAEGGRALGIVLAPIISALNLNKVVLTGPTALLDGVFAETASATVHDRTLSAVSNGLDVQVVTDDQYLVLNGATALVLAAELGVS